MGDGEQSVYVTEVGGVIMKRIVITGASRGIGRAIAVRLAGEGSHFILQGRDRGALDGACKNVMEKGGTVEGIIAELGCEGDVERLVESVGGGVVDILVNNAGVACVKPFGEVSLDEWRESFAVNVTAPFLLVRGLESFMGSGAVIVNILSIAARVGFGGWSVYSMSKFALEGFSQSIREELRERGIRVVNIYPSATDTGIWDGVPGEWSREKMMLPGEVADAVYYAVSRPGSVMVENITLGGIAGKL